MAARGSRDAFCSDEIMERNRCTANAVLGAQEDAWLCPVAYIAIHSQATPTPTTTYHANREQLAHMLHQQHALSDRSVVAFGLRVPGLHRRVWVMLLFRGREQGCDACVYHPVVADAWCSHLETAEGVERCVVTRDLSVSMAQWRILCSLTVLPETPLSST